MSLELSDTVYLMQCVLAVHDKICCQNQQLLLQLLVTDRIAVGHVIYWKGPVCFEGPYINFNDQSAKLMQRKNWSINGEY